MCREDPRTGTLQIRVIQAGLRYFKEIFHLYVICDLRYAIFTFRVEGAEPGEWRCELDASDVLRAGTARAPGENRF